jgi:hypothetical protein
VVEGDVTAARGLHGFQGGRALRGQPGQAAVRVDQGPLGDLVAGGDRLELGAHLLLPDDEGAVPLVGARCAVIHQPLRRRRRVRRE